MMNSKDLLEDIDSLTDEVRDLRCTLRKKEAALKSLWDELFAKCAATEFRKSRIPSFYCDDCQGTGFVLNGWAETDHGCLVCCGSGIITEP